jgi:hypothetical protein
MMSEPKMLRGTPVEADQGHVFATQYTPDLRYTLDTGEAIGRYLAELKEGRLIARRCHGCARVMIPPRMFCERCFRPTDDWVYVRDTWPQCGSGRGDEWEASPISIIGRQ